MVKSKVLLNVASPLIVPLFDAPSEKATDKPFMVVALELESVKLRLVTSCPSPPLIAPDILPPQIIESVNVKTPAFAPENVALPIILVLFATPVAKITPEIFADPVRPVELISRGSVVVEVIIGETDSIKYALLAAPGTLPVFTEQLFDVYQLLALFQSESALPHQ